MTPSSAEISRTKYNTSQVSNPLAFGWNPFQNISTSLQLVAGGNPHQYFGNIGAGTSSHQIPQYQSLARPRLTLMETLNFPDLLKLMNNPMHHNPAWSSVPIKLYFGIPKFEGKTGEDPSDHVTMFH